MYTFLTPFFSDLLIPIPDFDLKVTTRYPVVLGVNISTTKTLPMITDGQEKKEGRIVLSGD